MKNLMVLVLFYSLTQYLFGQCNVDLGILQIERKGSKEIHFTSQDSSCIAEFCARIKSAAKSPPVLTTIFYSYPKPSKNIIVNVKAISDILRAYGLDETRILFRFYETNDDVTVISFSGSIFQ